MFNMFHSMCKALCYIGLCVEAKCDISTFYLSLVLLPFQSNILRITDMYLLKKIVHSHRMYNVIETESSIEP
jgi:hypothetical protein